MKNCKISILIILINLFSFCGCVRHVNNNDGPNADFQVRRGINLSHWFSQNPDIIVNHRHFITKDDIALIAGLGYDHVRIPIDEENLWDEYGNQIESSFLMLKEGVDWCLANNLNVIIDLHQIRSHSFNNLNNILWTSKHAQNKFIQTWLSLSKEFRDYPKSCLAYELLNEAVADSSSQWNSLLKITIDSLRKYEPLRKIIVGSNRWQSPDTFNELIVPENDPNIILSFHFYIPHAFTHYRAPWMTAGSYKGEVNYPGQIISEADLITYPDSIVDPLRESNGYYTKDSLRELMSEPIKYAQLHHLQLYCGEFGVMPTVGRGDRLAWYTDVRSILEENNIAWSNWDYKGLFGIYYPDGQVDEYLVKTLIPSK